MERHLRQSDTVFIGTKPKYPQGLTYFLQLAMIKLNAIVFLIAEVSKKSEIEVIAVKEASAAHKLNKTQHLHPKRQILQDKTLIPKH